MIDEIFKVREFNIIVSENHNHLQSFNDERIRVLDKNAFLELKEFISGSESEDATALGTCGFNQQLGDFVTIKNYVGLIELPCGQQIEVIPKVDFVGQKKICTEKEQNELDAKCHKIMLEMLDYYLGQKFKVSGIAKLDSQDANLMEIFISMYVEEAQNLTKHGLKAAYIRTEDNLQVLKGKQLFNEHIKYNLSHKERFYVAFDEYDFNRPINKLIKSTLLKLQKESRDEYNRKNIRQLLAYFVDIDESTNYDYDFSQVVIDRTIQDYEQLLEWSKVFLYDKSFSNYSGDTGAKALLFPMEELFETYVAEKLKEIVHQEACSSDWKVVTQAKEQHLYQKLNGRKNSKFLLKPDILIKRNEQDIVLDTKWKRLSDNPSSHYGIKPADMYQMYVYSKRYKAKHIWLLYPYHNGIEEIMTTYDNNILYEGYAEGLLENDAEINVHVFFVRLDDSKTVENSIRKLIEKINGTNLSESAL